nr:putative late blight resistance protein homolog R1B-14 [Ipomoea batatas]
MVQKNLQTLLWLKVNGQDPTTTDFTTVPKLKKLWVLIDNELPSNAFDSLVHLDSLQKLKLKVESVCFNFPTDLPKHLKRLTLSGTFLPWVDMYNIERLPNLEVLKLTKFACSGPEWKLEDGSKFGCLKLLLIADSDLEYWEATHVNFPVLERLILKVCWDLKEIPSDFENISTLKLIQLDNCYSSLVESAKKIQEDIEMYGDTLVIRDLETKDGLPNKKSSEKMGAKMMEMDKKMKAIVGDEEALMEVDENLMILSMSKTGESQGIDHMYQHPCDYLNRATTLFNVYVQV